MRIPFVIHVTDARKRPHPVVIDLATPEGVNRFRHHQPYMATARLEAARASFAADPRHHTLGDAALGLLKDLS